MKFVTLDEVIKFAVNREDTAYKLYKLAAEEATHKDEAGCQQWTTCDS